MEIKIGKLPDTIWQRSVLKQVKHRRTEVLQGMGNGIHTAMLQLASNDVMVSCQNTVVCILKEDAEKALHKAINYLLAEGAEPIGVLTSILFPEGASEESLRSFVMNLEKICESLDVEIMSGQAEAAAAINQPILTITMVGKQNSSGDRKEDLIKPASELVMSGWAGQEGAALLAKVKAELLTQRYTAEFLENTAASQNNISIKTQVQAAQAFNVAAMQPLAESGIFGALWELSGRYHVGFEVSLKKIPIHQETIEICEFFELNPYRLSSMGGLLFITEHGNELVDQLSAHGIFAAVIGRIIKGNDKKILNEDETRFLEPPNEDELSKVYSK